MKYRLERIDEIKPFVPQLNLHLILGICVHSALENLYKAKSDSIVLDESQLLEIFENCWENEMRKATEVSGGTNPFNSYDLEAFHSRGVEYMKYYHNKFKPFDQAIAMQMEASVSFEIDEDIVFKGKIDRLDINGDTLIINDYKTNKSLPKDSNNTIEDQITLYSIGVLKNYGKQIKNLKGRVIYLHLQREHEWDITEEKINEVKGRYLDIIKEIEERNNRYEQGDEEAFPASGGVYACDECLLKHLCPKFKHLYMKDEAFNIADLGEATIKGWIEKYAVISEKYKALDIQRKTISEELGKYAKENNVSKLYGETKKVSITTKITYSKDEDRYSELEEKLKEEKKLQEVLGIDFNKLGKEFKEGNLEYEGFKELVKRTTSTYISRTSDLKEEEMDLDVLGNEELI